MIQAQPSFQGVIGAAREDITPPVGIYARNWGAAPQDVAEGIHRPLTLTCVTFQAGSGDRPLALIGADLGWWKSSSAEWFVRGAVLEALSLERGSLLLCLSHTHSGPALHPEDVAQPGGRLIGPYLEGVRAAAVRAAKRALASAVPATLVWRYGTCDLATNRDLRDPDRDRYLVGFNPSKSADDTLLVGRVTGADGADLATIVNYACHPTTLAWDNRLISPDYPGAMRDLVEAQTRAPCLFLQGASGELAPAEQYSGDAALADSHGRRLGHAVLAALEAMLPPATRLTFEGAVQSGAALGIWKRQSCEVSRTLGFEEFGVRLGLKPMPSAAEIEEDWGRTGDRIEKERLWRKLGLRKMLGDGSEATIGVVCWRLGDSLLFGCPLEAYSSLQVRLRERFRPFAVAVMNVANGWAGYLPPRDLYGLDLYSVWQTPFEAGSLERLTQEALLAGKRLQAADSRS